MNGSKKGQIFSSDFVVSIFLFTFILSLSILIWNNINDQISQREINSIAQTRLVSISTMLVETSGLPENWEDLGSVSEISQIGLATKGNVLSSSKILALKNLPYGNAMNILGLENERIYIVFIDANGNTLNENGEEMKFGLTPGGSESLYTISRPVIIENVQKQTIGIMKVSLW